MIRQLAGAVSDALRRRVLDWLLAEPLGASTEEQAPSTPANDPIPQDAPLVGPEAMAMLDDQAPASALIEELTAPPVGSIAERRARLRLR